MARDVATGRLVPASSDAVVVAATLECVGCRRPVVYRREHHRTRGATTTTFHVRGHFMHPPASDGGGGGGCHPETWMHRAAKALLVAHPHHPMVYRCPTCPRDAAPVSFRPVPPGTRRVEEHAVRCLDGERRVLDVAVFSRDQLVACIEVCHTHACDDRKLAQLSDLLGDRWCEVNARDVVGAIEAGSPIPVVTCAADVCWVCKVRRRERVRQFVTRMHDVTDEMAEQRERVRDEIDRLRAQIDSLQTQRAALRRTLDEDQAQLHAGHAFASRGVRQPTRQVSAVCVCVCGLAPAPGEGMPRDARLAELMALGGRPVLPSGPYAGVSLPALLTHDAQYVLRIADGREATVSSEIVLQARVLMRQHCHRCGLARRPGEAWKTLCRQCVG